MRNAGLAYAIILDPCGRSWSAHVPDLPGCVATGASIDETKARAELSADLIKRVAERDIGGPVHG